MDLFKNPFHILSASPLDDRRRISELAEGRGRSAGSEERAAAEAALIDPRGRLAAETAWLPGLEPRRVQEILSRLMTFPSGLTLCENLPPVARTNVLAAGLARLSARGASNALKWILEIASEFEKIDPLELMRIINRDRAVSGFPEVADLAAVEGEIQRRRRHFREVMKSALDDLLTRDLVRTVSAAADSATKNGSACGPLLIADMIDSYEMEAQEFLEAEEDNIEFLVDRLRSEVDAKKPDFIVRPTVSLLVKVLKNWAGVVHPIQIAAKSRGLSHDSSFEIAKNVHLLVIYLLNAHSKVEFSKSIISTLSEIFSFNEQISENILKDLININKMLS